MSFNLFLEKFSKPIAGEQPIGEDISYESDFEWLDTEIMKVGSLSHESVEWEKIEQKSMALLTEQSKDYRVVTFLTQCYLQKLSADSIAQVLSLLSVMLKEFWDGYPFHQGNKRAELNRRRQISQILVRVIQKVEELEALEGEIPQAAYDHLQTLVAEINNTLKAKEETLEEIENLEIALKRLLVETQSEADESAGMSGNSSNAINDGADPASTQNNITATGKRPAAKSKPSTTTSVLSIKDLFKSVGDQQTLNYFVDIFTANHEDLVAVVLRRIHLWEGILEAPMSDGEGETTLSAPSQELASRYRALLHDKNVDRDSWIQLENSLSKAPFWFDAHFMSATIAQKILSPEIAWIIQERVNQLLERLPQLKGLKFSNGEPFFSSETITWLEEKVSIGTTDTDAASGTSDTTQFYSLKPWNDYLFNAEAYYQKEGFTPALHYIHDEIEKAVNLREKTLWKLALSELYRQENLHELALHNDQLIAKIIQELPVTEWEPQLIENLAKELRIETNNNDAKGVDK